MHSPRPSSVQTSSNHTMSSSISERSSSSPSSRRLSSGETKETYEPSQRMRGHTSVVTGVVHLPDGQRIVTCSEDGSLRLWSLESGSQIGNDISLSPNGKTIASGNGDGTVRIWNVETGKVIAIWTERTCSSVCWSPNGERVVCGGHRTARVWHVKSGKTVPMEPGLQREDMISMQ